MNRIYDFLTTEKEPFLYVEKSVVCMKDGFLTLLSGKDGKKVIPPASHLLMMLGAGTSITQEAVIFSAQHDMHIAFARGGSNIHSFFMEGRYQDPKRLVNQVKNQEKYKFEIAKELMKIRFKLLNENKDEEVELCNNIDQLILFEARWAKSVYRKYCIKYKVDNFKRDFDGVDLINKRLNILNNVLYSLCSAIILSCSLNPSIGFIHGYSRRGGFSFDLADLIKTKTVFDFAFSEKEDKTIRQLMYKTMSVLKKDNKKYIKLLVKICLLLGEDDFNIEKFKEEIYDNFNL